MRRGSILEQKVGESGSTFLVSGTEHCSVGKKVYVGEGC